MTSKRERKRKRIKEIQERRYLLRNRTNAQEAKQRFRENTYVNMFVSASGRTQKNKKKSHERKKIINYESRRIYKEKKNGNMIE